METLEYYKIIKNKVQFVHAELVSMNCVKNEVTPEHEGEEEKSYEVKISMSREVGTVLENKADFFLHSKVGIPEGPFDFEITYKGVCIATDELDKVSFEQYVYNQIVPLLLPYVRECVSSTMARMSLPIFTLPTMDILDSLEANMDIETLEDE